jgi:hypothetical protein
MILHPARRHPLLARGQVLDMTYLLAYALVVVPLIALIGTGFSAELARAVPWLVLPRSTAVPHWLFVAAAVVAINAGLLVASGLIHLHFWDIAYRHVKTLGPLFLVQVIAAFGVAAALVLTRRLIVVAAAFLLMGGTIVGFILVRTHGLFGFKLGFTSGLAATVLVIEIVAVVMTAVTAWALTRNAGAGA